MLLKRITFIVNPNSANGATGRQWPKIRLKAKDRLGAFEVLVTTGPGDATRLTLQAVLSGVDIVVCVGGDGTLNEVVNGLTNEKGSLESEVLLGYIPRGTGCDLAKSLPVPLNLERALDNILNCRNRKIDLGKLTCRDHRGLESHRYFHNVLSLGLGGEVDARVNRTSKVFGGFLSFMWATLISILRFEKKRVHLRVDDFFDEEVTIWNVAVANGQYHGGGMWIAPGAAINDGLFQVTIIGDLSMPVCSGIYPGYTMGKYMSKKK